jgi:hypothetical protein
MLVVVAEEINGPGAPNQEEQVEVVMEVQIVQHQQLVQQILVVVEEEEMEVVVVMLVDLVAVQE